MIAYKINKRKEKRMNREEIRMEIDDVDELLVDLFARRMRAVRDMAA